MPPTGEIGVGGADACWKLGRLDEATQLVLERPVAGGVGRDDLPVVERPLVHERRARRVAGLVRVGGLHDRREVGIACDRHPVVRARHVVADTRERIHVGRRPAEERALAGDRADARRPDVVVVEEADAARVARDRRVVVADLAADGEADRREGPEDRATLDLVVRIGAHSREAGVSVAPDRGLLREVRVRHGEQQRDAAMSGVGERRPGGVGGEVDARPAAAVDLDLVLAGARNGVPGDHRVIDVAAVRGPASVPS